MTHPNDTTPKTIGPHAHRVVYPTEKTHDILRLSFLALYDHGAAIVPIVTTVHHRTIALMLANGATDAETVESTVSLLLTEVALVRSYESEDVARKQLDQVRAHIEQAWDIIEDGVAAAGLMLSEIRLKDLTTIDGVVGKAIELANSAGIELKGQQLVHIMKAAGHLARMTAMPGSSRKDRTEAMRALGREIVRFSEDVEDKVEETTTTKLDEQVATDLGEPKRGEPKRKLTSRELRQLFENALPPHHSAHYLVVPSNEKGCVNLLHEDKVVGHAHVTQQGSVIWMLTPEDGDLDEMMADPANWHEAANREEAVRAMALAHVELLRRKLS